jgi:hypothetical protein
VGKKQTKSGLQLRFAAVAETYDLREQALRQFFRPANSAYAAALAAATTAGTPPPTLQAALLEADRDCCLTLLAAIEAAFRLDYALRCERKDKQPISLSFRNLFRSYEYKLTFENQLLEQWKQHHPSIRQTIADLRAAFKYRHWLAHGRYWVPKFGLNVDIRQFYDLYTLAVQVETFGLLT